MEPLEKPQETEDKGTLVGYVSVYDSDSDADAEDDVPETHDAAVSHVIMFCWKIAAC